MSKITKERAEQLRRLCDEFTDQFRINESLYVRTWLAQTVSGTWPVHSKDPFIMAAAKVFEAAAEAELKSMLEPEETQ